MRVLACLLLAVQILGLILLAAPAYANSQAQAQNASRLTPEKYWSLETSLARTNSLYITGDGNDQASWDFAIGPAIPLSRDFKLSSLVEISHDLKTDREDYGRGQISLSKSSGYYGIAKRIFLVPRVTAGFPLSQDAKASSLQFSIRPGVKYSVNNDYLFTKKLGIALDLSLARNFHQYDTSIKGKVNTQWTASEVLELSWAFSDVFSLSGSFGHYDMRSYQGVATDALSHNEELGIQMNKNWALAFGHAWGAPFVASRKANGQDLNFEVTDEQNSMVYAQLGLSL